MSKPAKNIYQKLLEIQKEVSGLGKDGKSHQYKYVSGSKVLNHIKPKMNELGLILKQEVISIDNIRQDYNTRNGSKSEILTKAMMRFTWIDTESGEKDVNEFGANGQNDFEKGLGSALTYAERYFLLKYFHISTDEDDIDNPERVSSPPVSNPKHTKGSKVPEIPNKKLQKGTAVWDKFVDQLREGYPMEELHNLREFGPELEKELINEANKVTA